MCNDNKALTMHPLKKSWTIPSGSDKTYLVRFICCVYMQVMDRSFEPCFHCMFYILILTSLQLKTSYDVALNILNYRRLDWNRIAVNYWKKNLSNQM